MPDIDSNVTAIPLEALATGKVVEMSSWMAGFIHAFLRRWREDWNNTHLKTHIGALNRHQCDALLAEIAPYLNRDSPLDDAVDIGVLLDIKALLDARVDALQVGVAAEEISFAAQCVARGKGVLENFGNMPFTEFLPQATAPECLLVIRYLEQRKQAMDTSPEEAAIIHNEIRSLDKRYAALQGFPPR